MGIMEKRWKLLYWVVLQQGAQHNAPFLGFFGLVDCRWLDIVTSSDQRPLSSFDQLIVLYSLLTLAAGGENSYI